MAPISPQPDDRLSQLLGNLPRFAMRGGNPMEEQLGLPPGMLTTPGAAMPGMPPAARPAAPPPVAAAPAAAPPPATDDPANAALGAAAPPPVAAAPPMAAPPAAHALPTAVPTPVGPDMGNIRNIEQNIQDTTAKTKPKWYDRLLGIAAGTAAGYGSRDPRLAAEAANSIAYRKQTTALSPLYKQLQLERENLPFYEATNKRQQDTFKNQVDLSKEESEQGERKGRTDYLNARSNKLEIPRDYKQAYSMASASTDPEEKQRLTDLGDILKEAQQKGVKPPPTADQALADALAETDPEKKRIKTGIAHEMMKWELQKQAAGKTPPADPNKKGTRGQFKATEVEKKQQLDKAEAAYSKEVSLLAPDDEQGKAEALDRLNNAKQQAQNSFENSNSILGGEPEHMDVTAHGPKPAAPATSVASATKATNATPATSGPSRAFFKGHEGEQGLQVKDKKSGKLLTYNVGQDGTPVLVNSK